MIRRAATTAFSLLPALAAAVLLGIALTAQANAQPKPPPAQVCDGRFERLLQGFRIGPGELDFFLQDRDAFAACRAQLDAGIAEHRLIAAWIAWVRGAEDQAPAKQLFDAACAANNDVACFYAATYQPGTTTRAKPDAAFLQRLRPLVAKVPAAAHQAGYLLLRGGEGVRADAERGTVLLAAAAGAGDRWASFDLAMRDAANPDRLWLQRAADAGHVPAQLFLAAALKKDGQAKQSFDVIDKAARADPKFFRRFVAEARLQLALRYAQADGVEADPAQVRHWVQQSAELGNEEAPQIMQGK